MMIPVGQMGGVIMRVLFPALSRMRDDPRRMARAWSRALGEASGSFTLPLALTMAATAPALVKVLYGEKWLRHGSRARVALDICRAAESCAQRPAARSARPAVLGCCSGLASRV